MKARPCFRSPPRNLPEFCENMRFPNPSLFSRHSLPIHGVFAHLEPEKFVVTNFASDLQSYGNRSLGIHSIIECATNDHFLSTTHVTLFGDPCFGVGIWDLGESRTWSFGGTIIHVNLAMETDFKFVTKTSSTLFTLEFPTTLKTPTSLN